MELSPKPPQPTGPLHQNEAESLILHGPDSANTALTPEQIAARTAVSSRLWASVGECVSILMRSRSYRDLTLAELEILLVPPLSTGQFMIAESRSKSDGIVRPVALAIWACVSPQIDQRLTESIKYPLKLTVDDWKSGDIVWIIALAGDERVAGTLLNRLQQSTLQGRTVKMRVANAAGDSTVLVLPEPKS